MLNKIIDLINKIESEPLAIGEPAESVQLGRLQVCDDLREIEQDALMETGTKSLEEFHQKYLPNVHLKNVIWLKIVAWWNEIGRGTLAHCQPVSYDVLEKARSRAFDDLAKRIASKVRLKEKIGAL